MYFNYSYNLMSSIFLVILTVYFFKIPIFPNKSNRYFKAILVQSCIAITFDTLSSITINNINSEYSIALQSIVTVIFFLSYWSLTFVFFRYTLILSKMGKYLKSKLNYVLLGVLIFEIITILTTPFTHAIFYMDPIEGYVHGPLYTPIALLNISILLISGLIVLKKKSNFTKIQRFAIPLYIFMLFTANTIQVFFPLVCLTGAALALATFIMFLTLHNPITYYDSLTQVYSRESFQDYLSQLILLKKDFQIIIVDIINTTMINRTLGEMAGSQIISQVASKLKEVCPNNLIFRLKGDAFIIFTQKENNKEQILNELYKKFPFEYKFGASKFAVHVHIKYSETLTGFKDISEAIGIIQDCADVSKGNKTTLINEASLEEIMKTRKVEKALKRAIDEKDFCVYLQPIFNKKSELFENAEALVRIKDPELGLIMPDEFIKIAEKNGLITKLTPIVIEQVCKFLSKTKLPDSFKKISINLSVIDCLDKDLDKTILNTISNYDIDPSSLIFEITETVASLAPQVKSTMNNLKKLGIGFALDDFGSGYANLDAVIKLPFDIIKIDRELVLLTQDNRYKVMLEGLVKMMLNLKFDIIVEGIETKEQSKLVCDMGAFVHQGYLYSRPVDLDTFVKVINDNANLSL